MQAKDIDLKGAKDLMKAVFNRAVCDHIKMTALGVDRINYIGNKKEIEEFLDTNMARAGTVMNVGRVKERLKEMTREEAIGFMKVNNANYAYLAKTYDYLKEG